MTPREVSDGEVLGKIILFITSFVAGTICGILLYRYSRLPLASSILWGSLSAVLNPFAARLSVWLSQRLHCLAFQDTYESWSIERKVWMGAFWAITLPFWVVVFIFFVSINHIFR